MDRGQGSLRRLADDLPPKEAGNIAVDAAGRFRSGNVAVRDVQVGVAVMVEIPRVRRPRPPANLDTGLRGDILKFPIAQISIERIAARVLTIKSANVFGVVLVKAFL